MKVVKLVVIAVFGLTLLLANTAYAETIKIGALVTGQVIEVAVKEGQRVKKGQLLMRIDDERYQARLKQAKADAEQARLQFEDSKIELDQALDLYDRTVTAKRTLDAAQLAHDVAQQKLLKARAGIAFYQAWSKYYVIKAPVNATVDKIMAPLGTTVYKENNPLIQLTR